MDLKIVAKNLIPLIAKADVPLEHPEYGRDHLLWMCDEIINEKVTGEKGHRWVGWIQGCVCIAGAATLEELKEINIKA